MTETTKDQIIANLLDQIELLKQEITALQVKMPKFPEDDFKSSCKEPSLHSHLVDQEIAEHGADGKANWHNLELDCLRKNGLIL